MTIIRNRTAAEPRRAPVQRRPHDPATCGLHPSLDCDACRAAAARREQAAARRDRRIRRRTRQRETRGEARELAKLIGLHPRRLRKAIMRIIAQEVARVALAVHKEASRHAR